MTQVGESHSEINMLVNMSTLAPVVLELWEFKMLDSGHFMMAFLQ